MKIRIFGAIENPDDDNVDIGLPARARDRDPALR
jgi:hypothetical protein